MNKKRPKIKLKEKETGEVKVLDFVQNDSKQGFWCVDGTGEWKWYTHDKWEKAKK